MRPGDTRHDSRTGTDLYRCHAWATVNQQTSVQAPQATNNRCRARAIRRFSQSCDVVVLWMLRAKKEKEAAAAAAAVAAATPVAAPLPDDPM